MTPVATTVAVSATSWDAALAETLSQPAPCTSADGARTGSVHSVHTRALNIQHENSLIALIDDDLDDAPSTIRVAIRDWTLRGIRTSDEVRLHRDRIEILSAPAALTILLEYARPWSPAHVSTAPLTAEALKAALAALSGFTSPTPSTPFGLASASMLATALDGLRTAATRLLHNTHEHGQSASVSTAATSLVGLGEGLTPSGDDILTGLALVAAHDAFALGPLVAPLRATIDAADERTTLLSAVTLRAAVSGRGRDRLHDLIAAVIRADRVGIADAAIRTTEIGHSSGHDILTGIRLGLELAASIHQISPPSEGDHR